MMKSDGRMVMSRYQEGGPNESYQKWRLLANGALKHKQSGDIISLTNSDQDNKVRGEKTQNIFHLQLKVN